VASEASDCVDEPYVQPGAGWVDAAGVHEIVDLARDSQLDDECYVRIESPSSRESISAPGRYRVDHLLQRHRAGANALLAPRELNRERAKRERAHERAAREDEDHEGHVATDGRIVSQGYHDSETEENDGG